MLLWPFELELLINLQETFNLHINLFILPTFELFLKSHMQIYFWLVICHYSAAIFVIIQKLIAKSRFVTKSSQTTKQLDFRRQIGVINPHQKSVEINEAQLLKVKVLSKRVNSLKK